MSGFSALSLFLTADMCCWTAPGTRGVPLVQGVCPGRESKARAGAPGTLDGLSPGRGQGGFLEQFKGGSRRGRGRVSGVVSGETRGMGAVLWPIHRPALGTGGSGTPPGSPGALGRP